MNLKKLSLAAVAGTTLASAAPAFADPPGWAPAYGWRAPYRHHHYQPAYRYAPPPVYYARPAPIYYARPAPVYYAPPRYFAPPPVYYAPPPVYYAPPPRPVLYGQIPFSPGVGISFNLGL